MLTKLLAGLKLSERYFATGFPLKATSESKCEAISPPLRFVLPLAINVLSTRGQRWTDG